MHLVNPVALKSRYYYYPYVTDEKPERLNNSTRLSTNNSTKGIQFVSGRARIQTQVVWLQKSVLLTIFLYLEKDKYHLS